MDCVGKLDDPLSMGNEDLTKGADPLTKGVVRGDCWPRVQMIHLSHAPTSIEVIRKGVKCYVTGEELCDSDFENMVWTTWSK
tara:strand:+ start:1689 stop:1934 length:246 start_codon:yes stop_codon:yes gene_type:complete